MYRVLWGVVVLVLAISLVFTFKPENINTNLFALLPAPAVKSVAEDVIPRQTLDRFSEKLSRKVIFLVTAKSDSRAIELTNELYVQLEESKLFAEIQHKIEESELRAMYSSFQPYQFNLLSNSDRKGLQANPEKWLSEKLVNQLVSPVAGVNSDSLLADPFGLYRDFLTNLPMGSKLAEIKEGYTFFHANGSSHILVTAELSGSAFDQGIQDKFGQLMEKLTGNQTLKKNTTVFGVIRYALKNRLLAQQEMSTIGTGSLIGIIFIFFFVFRRFFLLGYILLPVAIGILTAFSVSMLLFGEIHLISLVFGASLIGVSIDYTLHYCCSNSNLSDTKNSNEALSEIKSALTIGLITSSLGYLTLSIADFPALRQMAALAVAGLVGAYFTVIFWMPVLVNKPLTVHAGVAIWIGKVSHWLRQRKKIPVWLILFAIVASYGTSYLIKNSRDDVKILRAHTPELDAIDVRLQTILGEFPNSQFFVVRARTPEQTMKNERNLLNKLRNTRSDRGRVYALSEWLPDASTQQTDYRLLRTSMIANKKLDKYIMDAGLPVDMISPYRAKLVSSKEKLMDIETFVASPLGKLHRHLWLGEIDNYYYSIVNLYGYKDLLALNTIADSSPNYDFIDRSASISQVLEKYRIIIEKMFPLVLLVIFLVLSWRFGFKDSFRVVSAPLLSALLSFLVINLVVGEYNLFSIFGLIITIAISIDYAVFINESSGNNKSTYLAISLASLTTLLALGLLSLSHTPALSAFGLSLLLGVLFSFILTPLIVRPKEAMS